MHNNHARERLMNHSQRHAAQGEHPLRYATIYTRVSTEDQARGYSLPSQIEACQKLAEHESYCVPGSYVFSDDVTGDQLDRPGSSEAA
jgi:DNA invertase Pin-like site-specific DNA recombinase